MLWIDEGAHEAQILGPENRRSGRCAEEQPGDLRRKRQRKEQKSYSMVSLAGKRKNLRFYSKWNRGFWVGFEKWGDMI